jgi:DNA-binding transcriptional regulator YiaG
MTPTDFKRARQSLALTQPQAADAFGISLRQYKTWEADGPSTIAARYMAALLSGYRPDDWPDARSII